MQSKSRGPEIVNPMPPLRIPWSSRISLLNVAAEAPDAIPPITGSGESLPRQSTRAGSKRVIGVEMDLRKTKQLEYRLAMKSNQEFFLVLK